MTAGYRSMVVIDAKHEESLARSITLYDVSSFAQTFPHRSSRIVFRPDPALEGADVDAVFARVMRYGHTAVVVHDAALFATATRIPPNYRRAILTGASVQVPVWSLIQRPIGVHNVLLSETDHVFLFTLHLLGDREKLAGVVGPGALEPAGVPFSFLYYGPSTAGQTIRCDPLEVASSDPPDNRQPGNGHDHGHRGNLRGQSDNPDREHPRPVRPGRRRLTPKEAPPP